MNLKQLETFYWAGRLDSFSAVAERLNATQSTVSQRILELERDLGVPLFDRSQRSARLSARGRDLMIYAEQVLRLTAEMRARVAEEAAAGLLRIGVAEVVSMTWLPRLMSAIHERFPKITVDLDEALTHDLTDRLRSGTLDLVLGPGRIEDYAGPSLPLGEVTFSWMAGAGIALPGGELRPHDLHDWPIITLARESYHHLSIQEWFRAGNAYMRRVVTCRSMRVASSLAMAGLGITLLPPQCVEADVAAGRLRVLEVWPPLAPVGFSATSSIDSVQPIARRIARLAFEISDFTGKPATLS